MNKIGWCDITVNPIVGCSKCSPGCANCYAEKFAARLAKNPKTSGKYSGVVDENGKWTGKLSDAGWSCLDSLPMYSTRRVFLGSMTDIFHENMTPDLLDELLSHLIGCPNLTFMLLTKRPQNAIRLLREIGLEKLDKNIWLGVTICNQEEANAKLPLLLEIPASLRFVSVEPMLEQVCLVDWLGKGQLDWVICGGETGPGARPMETEWACFLAGQCYGKNVPFFFKQLGGRNPLEKRSKAVPEELSRRQFPEVRHA